MEKYWYKKNPVSLVLTPVSWLFCALVLLRRQAYLSGFLPERRFAVPVIVVGNISVGGTGKTPLVVWLIDLLKSAGFRPGIVSRGYGGRASSWPQQVRADSDPATVGDEPVLLARRCDCPIAVGPDRVAAVRALLENSDCDVVVSDDGLQHYALGRDIEIAVLDGVRRFGNGRCLPAGPLREPQRRLRDVDFIVSNGLAARLEYPMKLSGEQALNLRDETRPCALEDFRGLRVHAVAGIGHPERFFSQLRQRGLQLIEHAFPDHYAFRQQDIEFDDDLPVLMTEKDAVKCRRFASERHWYLPVAAELDERLGPRILSLLAERVNATDHETKSVDA